ncbi:hypothetical protein EMIT079MI2_10533 [Bacillus sp. IT-79MI2]
MYQAKRKYLSKAFSSTNENIDFILFYVTVTTYLQVGCYFFTIELKRNRFLFNEILALTSWNEYISAE